MKINSLTAAFVSLLLAAALTGCGDTWSGLKKDTGDNVEATGEAIEKAGEKIKK